jgi:hypothetical protein
VNFRHDLASEKYLYKQWFITLLEIIRGLKNEKRLPWIA